MPSLDILSLQASQNLNTAMGSFERMLSLIHPRILKDLVKIIRLEQVDLNEFLIGLCFFLLFRILKLIIYGEYVGV